MYSLQSGLSEFASLSDGAADGAHAGGSGKSDERASGGMARQRAERINKLMWMRRTALLRLRFCEQARPHYRF